MAIFEPEEIGGRKDRFSMEATFQGSVENCLALFDKATDLGLDAGMSVSPRRLASVTVNVNHHNKMSLDQALESFKQLTTEARLQHLTE